MERIEETPGQRRGRECLEEVKRLRQAIRNYKICNESMEKLVDEYREEVKRLEVELSNLKW